MWHFHMRQIFKMIKKPEKLWKLSIIWSRFKIKILLLKIYWINLVPKSMLNNNIHSFVILKINNNNLIKIFPLEVNMTCPIMTRVRNIKIIINNKQTILLIKQKLLISYFFKIVIKKFWITLIEKTFTEKTKIKIKCFLKILNFQTSSKYYCILYNKKIKNMLMIKSKTIWHTSTNNKLNFRNNNFNKI